MIAAPAPACSGARSVTAALTEDQQAEQDEEATTRTAARISFVPELAKN